MAARCGRDSSSRKSVAYWVTVTSRSSGFLDTATSIFPSPRARTASTHASPIGMAGIATRERKSGSTGWEKQSSLRGKLRTDRPSSVWRKKNGAAAAKPAVNRQLDRGWDPRQGDDGTRRRVRLADSDQHSCELKFLPFSQEWDVQIIGMKVNNIEIISPI